MRRIQSAEVETRLPQILDEVERGETVVITRHGRAIARIVPETSRRADDLEAARRGIEAIQKANGPISVEDILSSLHEGRRS